MQATYVSLEGCSRLEAIQKYDAEHHMIAGIGGGNSGRGSSDKARSTADQQQGDGVPSEPQKPTSSEPAW